MSKQFAHMFDEYGLLTPSAIDAYVQGKLNAADTRAFEQHISENEFEADAVEGYMNAQQTTQDAPKKFIGDNNAKGLSVGFKKYIKPLAAAAGLALLVSISYAVFNKNKEEKISQAVSTLKAKEDNVATENVNEYDVKKQEVEAIKSTPNADGRMLPSANDKTITIENKSVQENKSLQDNKNIATNNVGSSTATNTNEGDVNKLQDAQQAKRPAPVASSVPTEAKQVAAPPAPPTAAVQSTKNEDESYKPQTDNVAGYTAVEKTSSTSVPVQSNYTNNDNNSNNNLRNYLNQYQQESRGKIGPSNVPASKKNKALKSQNGDDAVMQRKDAADKIAEVPINSMSNYYNLYKQGNYTAALAMIQAIVVNKSNVNEVQLETAKCYIKLNNKAKAQQILNTLIEGKASNSNEAKDLLNGLR
jgi:Tetratricopeptide repeat